MNTEPTTNERQKLIAAAADSYTTPPLQSHTLLMPIRDSLATLRHKGASYRTIAHILRNVDIKVSLDTLARFCREHVEQPPPRKNKRRAAATPAAHQTEGTPPPNPPAPPTSDSPVDTKPTKEPDTPSPLRGKGPRIADPSNI